MITSNRNLRAVLSYEEKLLEKGLKLAVVKNRLITVKNEKHESFIARLLTQKIRRYLGVRTLSLNELAETKDTQIKHLNSDVFNSTSLLEYKEMLKLDIKTKMKLPLISNIGNRDLIVESRKEDLAALDNLLSIKNDAWHVTFESMLKDKDGVVISVKEIPNDGYRHVRVISPKLNMSYVFPIGSNDFFDVGYMLGVISKDIHRKFVK